MLLISVITSILYAGSAAATYGMAMPSASPVASSVGPMPSSGNKVSVQVVKVSDKNGSLTFSPNNIVAPVGSMVQFQFYPKKHSVVQSTFANPCVPINNIMSNVTGFFSGFMPTTPDAQMKPVYTIMVNSTAPIWYYCSQGKHCQAGMVGVINAPAKSPEKNIQAYAALAAMAPANLSPGGSANSTSPNVGSGNNYTMTAMPPAATTEAASTPTDAGSAATDTAAAISTITMSSTGTSTAAIATFTGAASGSLVAGPKELYRGCAAAGILAAITVFLL